MIWPGRPLATAALIPALLTFGLFLTPALRPAILALDAVVVVIALVDLATLRGARKFIVERRGGAVGSIGEPFGVELIFENEGKAARRLRVRDDVPDSMTADPDEFLVQIARRGRVALTYTATPQRRGTSVFEQVDALVASRLGFWQRSVAWPIRTEVKIYPDIHQIGRYTLLARRDKLSSLGLRRSRRLGTDNEFERLRDYTEGDEPRHLDWKATARRQKLTVRAHQINQSQRILFLIDCGRLMSGDAGGGLAPLDHAFNAMLLLAHVALLQGDQVGLLVYSDRVRAFVPPAGGPKRINRLVHAVHNIFPELVEPRHDRAFVELEKRCRKRSLVVLMTDVFDEVNARQIHDHLSNLVGRHLPLGVFLRHRDLFGDPFSAPAAVAEADRASEQGDERAVAARAIVDADNVRIIARRPVPDGFKLSGSAKGADGVRVRPLVHVDAAGHIVTAECTCGFYRGHQLTRGPCEHILAVRLAHMRRLASEDAAKGGGSTGSN